MLIEKLCFSDEIERNRRKVMEINYFLDNQQINFEQLTTEIAADDGSVGEVSKAPTDEFAMPDSVESLPDKSAASETDELSDAIFDQSI